MGVITAAFAPDVTFERKTEDADGDGTWAAVGTYKAVPDLTGPAVTTGSGTAVAQSGTVFVQRGATLQVGDRFPWAGAYYTLTGGPHADMDHPMTGDDFGWIYYTCVGAMARWGTGNARA